MRSRGINKGRFFNGEDGLDRIFSGRQIDFSIFDLFIYQRWLSVGIRIVVKDLPEYLILRQGAAVEVIIFGQFHRGDPVCSMATIDLKIHVGMGKRWLFEVRWPLPFINGA